MIFSKLRQLLQPLRYTPLHPQWLVLRGEKQNRRNLADKLNGRILDIGCGNRQMQALLKPDAVYIALDYPATHAKGYTEHPDIFGDGQSLPFCDDCFDSIMILDVLEHLPSPDLCIQESARVLRHGGLLIIQTPFLYPLHDMPHDFQRWTLPGLKRLVQQHGFAVDEQQIFGAPCETASALMAIALAKAILDSLKNRSPAILMIPLLIPAIISINLLGWLLARILPNDDFMPLGYQLICLKIL